MTIKPFLIAVSAFLTAFITCSSVSHAQAENLTPEQISGNNDYIIRGSITWTDNDNNDGLRPYALEVTLMMDDEMVDSTKASVVNGWVYEFTDLPEPASENTYTVKLDPVTGYEVTCSRREAEHPRTFEYDFNAVHTKTIVSISGSVMWDDDDDRDGIRPESIIVELLAGRENAGTITVTAQSGWKYHFDGQNKYDGAREIPYRIESHEIPGYEMDSGDLSVAYRHIPITTSVDFILQFDDRNNQDNTRPEKITATLMDRTKLISKQELSPSTGWKCTFSDIPLNENGKKIAYTVEIPDVEGYSKTRTDYGCLLSENKETTTISGTILWNDGGDEMNKRPEEVQVILYSNGCFLTSTKARADTGWKYSFMNLLQTNKGSKIRYTVSQSEIPGYDTSINDLTITNTMHKAAEPEPETETGASSESGKKKPALLPFFLIAGLSTGFMIHLLRKKRS